MTGPLWRPFLSAIHREMWLVELPKDSELSPALKSVLPSWNLDSSRNKCLKAKRKSHSVICVDGVPISTSRETNCGKQKTCFGQKLLDLDLLCCSRFWCAKVLSCLYLLFCSNFTNLLNYRSIPSNSIFKIRTKTRPISSDSRYPRMLKKNTQLSQRELRLSRSNVNMRCSECVCPI